MSKFKSVAAREDKWVSVDASCDGEINIEISDGEIILAEADIHHEEAKQLIEALQEFVKDD